MLPPRRGLQALAAFVSFTVFFYNVGPWLIESRLSYFKYQVASSVEVETDSHIHPTVVHPLNETNLLGLASVAGYTIFGQLYLRNGTFYVLTSDPSLFPARRTILSRPLDLNAENELEPTDDELQFLDPGKSTQVLGDHFIHVEGFSVIVTDTTQFMTHFYHWWGEIILGAWRVYSALMHESGTTLPLPARFILPHAVGGEWRDRAGVNAPLMRAGFPAAAIENAGLWEDLLKLDQTVVFERAMIINRAAAHRDPLSSRWHKMISSTQAISAPEHFWEPLRSRTLSNVLGFLPALDARGAVVSPPQAVSAGPTVTYISRQGGGRRLLDRDHAGLVEALRGLEAEGVCEVQVVMMERMRLREQVEAVARSTVIVGVHGNGLTHQIWMPPSPRSTVIEIFNPGAYVYDYEILARNMGHQHYAVWNDTFVTYPKGTTHEGIEYGDDFNGDSIPVHGPAVARVIRQRLAETEGVA